MKRIFLVLFITGMTAGAAFAGPVTSAHTEAELVSEVTSVQPGSSFWIALRLKMEPRWHTYWRNSGDSGLPTRLDWQLPEGFKAGPLQWPYPERVDLPPLTVYAYEGEVFLLTQISVPGDAVPGSETALKAQAHWLACEVNCIPGEADLELRLPVLASVPLADTRHAESFAAFRAKLPLSSSDWTFSAGASGSIIRIGLMPPPENAYTLSRVSFFPYDNDWIDHASAQKFQRTSRGFELTLKRSRLSRKVPDFAAGVLVAAEGWRGPGSEKALEISVPITAAAGEPAPQGTTFPLALLFAFAGGLILNLMPCVFPVLSIKILNFVEQAQERKIHPGLHGLVFTLGVLVSFWLLAGALLILRAGGKEIGWGFQLQSPMVLAALTLLFFYLALSLFGLFEIGAGLAGLGNLAMGRSGLWDSFAGGVLATVIATPCTAPFMGVALGFAVTAPAPVSMAVFTSLGLGMAFPYQLLSCFPALLRFVPRPGAWMVHLKRVMGLALLATAAWLGWILDLQKGRMASALLGGACLLMLAGLALVNHTVSNPGNGKFRRWGGYGLVLAGILAAFSAARMTTTAPLPVSKAVVPAAGLAWETYSPERLDFLLREGTPVFLDFTAAWCLTCHVNEKAALEAARVREAFREKGIVLMKADWTSRDETVTRALASYGRSSIPLYVLYGPGPSASPVLLPEILTPDIVLKTLRQVFTEKNPKNIMKGDLP